MERIKITEIILQYGKLNQIYTDVISGKEFGFRQQKYICDFYNEHKEMQIIESSIIKLLLKTDSERYTILMNSLKQEIEKNIAVYENHQSQFDNLDIEKICNLYANQYNGSIEQQMQITHEYHKDMVETNCSLEVISFRSHTQQEEELLNIQYERRKEEYKKEAKILSDLYNMQYKAKLEASQNLENRFKDMSELDRTLLFLLEKYAFLNKKEGNANCDTDIITNQPLYFPMKLVSTIYEICNGKQFEEISETDFYSALNLQPCEKRLKIRSREKVRVCYLIFLMSETLPKHDKETWKGAVMDLLGIDSSYYKSKYKEPVSDFSSDSNQKFAEEMKAIFR